MKLECQIHSEEVCERPKGSYRVREYFLELLNENLQDLLPERVNDNWTHRMAISFYYPKDGDLITILPPNTWTSERLKQYTIMTDARPFLTGPDYVYSMALLISKFLGHLSKVNGSEYFQSWIMKHMDKDSLFSIPYPAPFKDQHYILDEQPDIIARYFKCQ